MDLDETLLHTIERSSNKTQNTADITYGDMSVYFRPYLMELLYAFATKQINMEIALCTKGT